MNKKSILFLSVVVALTTLGSCKKKATDVKGCKDANAFNYNAAATTDDGSCQLPQADVKSAVYDVTGTWCHVCGELGIPIFDQIRTDLKGSIVPFSVHSGDEFSCTAGDALLNAFLKTTSVPSFGEKTDLYPCYTPKSAGVNFLKTKINSTIAKDILVGTGIAKSVSGNTLTVTTNTKFIAAESGTEYYLATFILENGLVADQITDHGTISMTHNNVVRHCFTPSITGELIGSGEIAAGKVVTKTYTKTIPVTWKAANLSVATVIYYKDTNGKMQFENANIAE